MAAIGRMEMGEEGCTEETKMGVHRGEELEWQCIGVLTRLKVGRG